MAKKKINNLYSLGNFLILIGVAIILFTFAPAVKEETKYEIQRALGTTYSLNPLPGTKQIKLTPPNTDFSVVIPKIAAVAPIVDNVDSQDPKSYLPALMRGVAHAKGTSYPGEVGNTYLFAHSTDTFFNVSRYNAVFYLLGKLQKGDEVDVFYKGKEIKYKVSDIRVVAANDVSYLGKIKNTNTLTLQTCYPPGTTLERLVVTADQI